jgi:hypothetical protein
MSCRTICLDCASWHKTVERLVENVNEKAAVSGGLVTSCQEGLTSTAFPPKKGAVSIVVPVSPDTPRRSGPLTCPAPNQRSKNQKAFSSRNFGNSQNFTGCCNLATVRRCPSHTWSRLAPVLCHRPVLGPGSQSRIAWRRFRAPPSNAWPIVAEHCSGLFLGTLHIRREKRVSGRGSIVDQSGASAGGDIVGRDKVSPPRR